MTPIACQVPGTAWQKTCTRASASGAYSGSTAKTTPDVPSTTETGPGAVMPIPSAAAAWSPAPATAVDSCAARQPLGGHLERVADLGRPAPVGDVEEQRPRGVRHVDRVLAGQPQPDVVLRQQDVADPRVGLRLVLSQPEQLRRGEPGQRAVAGERDQPLETDLLLDLRALGLRPLVVPEDRRAEHPLVLVEDDEPVHLPGEADRPVGKTGEACLGRPPPVLGVLLRPAGLGCAQSG